MRPSPMMFIKLAGLTGAYRPGHAANGIVPLAKPKKVVHTVEGPVKPSADYASDKPELIKSDYRPGPKNSYKTPEATRSGLRSEARKQVRSVDREDSINRFASGEDPEKKVINVAQLAAGVGGVAAAGYGVSEGLSYLQRNYPGLFSSEAALSAEDN